MDRPSLIFSCAGYELDLGKRTHIMGVLNITSDSFYDGEASLDVGAALKRAGKMVEEGADIIDVGGESTRPGAMPVPSDEERKRILPVIREIRKNFPIPISVDTYKSETADAALAEGADIINDVGGLRRDPLMAGVAARYKAGVVVMHMLGTPRTMQDSPVYGDLMKEIGEYLGEGIDIGTRAGISRDRFIVDPGIGFGKTTAHNLTILKNLSTFLDLNKPILVGLSRKSFLGQITGLPVQERLEGSLAASVIAILNGASILRTHDVKETKRAAEVADLFRNGST
ncbi:MAG: dihydropteroate synthase [Nitrospinae bacterium]|nr:dihydropteroate synthase [Nitrospinota bacterium]